MMIILITPAMIVTVTALIVIMVGICQRGENQGGDYSLSGSKEHTDRGDRHPLEFDHPHNCSYSRLSQRDHFKNRATCPQKGSGNRSLKSG